MSPAAIGGQQPTQDSNNNDGINNDGSSSNDDNNNTNNNDDGDDSNDDDNSDESNEDDDNNEEESNPTATASGSSSSGSNSDVLASPTSSSENNAGIFSGGNGNVGATNNANVPSDVFSNDPSAPNDVNNKQLGIGLGVGIGLLAALGLAGLFVLHRRKQGQQEIALDDSNSPPTRWRPSSFMGVVASVVNKLPRSPSQRSKASNDMLSNASPGVAVGHGEGAIETRQY